MPWKTGEARLRMSRWTRRSFPSDERKVTSASGASKLYGAMNEVQTICTNCGGCYMGYWLHVHEVVSTLMKSHEVLPTIAPKNIKPVFPAYPLIRCLRVSSEHLEIISDRRASGDTYYS